MDLLIDPIRMIRDIRGTTVAINIWGVVLNMVQLIGGLIFITTVESRVVFVTLIVTLIIAGQIHKRTPFSRLIGLCHLPWLALLPWLLLRLLTNDLNIYLTVWGYMVCFLITVSLLFEVYDVYRYMKGDKLYSWSP